MPNALIVAAIVAIFVLVIAVSGYLYYQREAAFARVATSLGLQFSQRDDSSVRRLGFPLFHEGLGAESGNLLTGAMQGTPVSAFDFAYWTEWRDSKGVPHRQYHRFLCAVTDIAVSGPALTIEHRGLLGRVAGSLGLDGIQFESDDFDKAYHVSCADRRFASAMVDPAMMAWLLDAPSPVAYQTAGGHLLVASTDRRPEAVPGLLHALLDFRAHIPAFVTHEYPAGR